MIEVSVLVAQRCLLYQTKKDAKSVFFLNNKLGRKQITVKLDDEKIVSKIFEVIIFLIESAQS